MELIQPFINSADAVLAETLHGPAEVRSVDMGEDAYRRQGIAASVVIRGDIEGRIIFDLEPETARNVGRMLGAESDEDSSQMARETASELANMVIGNAVTLLNDRGFHFKVFPPEVHSAEEGYRGNEETEALVMCFDTPSGKIYMNIALRYNRRRRDERVARIQA